MKLFDVTVPLDAKLPTYPGNTPFSVEPIKRIGRGDSSNVSTLRMSAHAGTHLDAPRHFFDDGAATEAFALDLLLGPARVVEIASRTGITADELSTIDLSRATRVLFKTLNSQLWDSADFHSDYVGVTASGAAHLIAQGVKVVGIDYLSVECYKAPGAPAHRTLLGAGAVVIEGLNLRDVEPGVYEMVCLPLRIVGAEGAPARVVLRRP